MWDNGRCYELKSPPKTVKTSMTYREKMAWKAG